MLTKSMSNFERFMADPMRKGICEKDYANYLQSELKLQKALADGERSAEQGGWHSAADVRKNIQSTF
jgi:hypothetical protein